MSLLLPEEIQLINLEEDLDENNGWYYVPRDEAVQKLKQSTGQDFGNDAAKWRTWLTKEGRIPQRDHLGRTVWSSRRDRTPSESCRTFAALLTMDAATVEQYAMLVTPIMVSAPDAEMQTCVNLIPAGALARYGKYLRAVLEPVDYMPGPGSLIFPAVYPDQIEMKQCELQPKYKRLFQLVHDRLCTSS